MSQSSLRFVPLTLFAFAVWAFATFAFAHQTADPVHMEAHAAAQAEGSLETRPPKPLDLIRAEKMKENIIGKNQERPFGSSTPPERPFKEPGMNALKERFGSTSPMRGQLKGLVRQHAGLIRERFSLAINHFEKLVTRIESRISKMKAEGIATASVEAELEAAKIAHVEAKADIEAVRSFIESVEDSSDRAAIKAELQAKIKTAQTSIREAHQALQKVVRSLVALAKENKPRAETSTSVEVEAGATVETQ